MIIVIIHADRYCQDEDEHNEIMITNLFEQEGIHHRRCPRYNKAAASVVILFAFILYLYFKKEITKNIKACENDNDSIILLQRFLFTYAINHL